MADEIDPRNKGWQDVPIRKPDITLLHHIGFGSEHHYLDQYGIKHRCMAYDAARKVKITLFRENEHFDFGRYSCGSDIHAEAVDEDGGLYTLRYNNACDGLGSDHAWNGPLNTWWHYKAETWAGLAVVPVEETIESKDAQKESPHAE